MTDPMNFERPRLTAFRQHLIERIPCYPPTVALSKKLRCLPFEDIVHIWVSWAQRLVRPTPRQIVFRDGFWNSHSERYRSDVEALVSKIAFGADVTSYLSDRVRTHGYVPEETSRRRVRGIDWQRMDFALNRYGVHHLHLRPSGSKELLFIEFGRDYAALLHLGNHASFFSGEFEHVMAKWQVQTDRWVVKGVTGLTRELNALERTQLAIHGVNTPAHVDGKFVFSGMILSSGDSVQATRHTDEILLTLEQDDPCLDGGIMTGIVPEKQLLNLKGRRWIWTMMYCDLVLVEQTTKLGFVRAFGPN